MSQRNRPRPQHWLPLLFLFAPGLLAAATGSRVGKLLQTIDADGNGMISRAEARASPALAADFDRIDANRDGQITPDELRAWSKGGGIQNDVRRTRTKGGLEEQFARADSNADGFLSRNEVRTGMPRAFGRFDAIDINHDGGISREELRAYLRARQEARGGKP